MTTDTTIAPTLTNVEKATVGFIAGGAFNAGNSSSLTTITVEEKTDGTAAPATVINVADGTQVILLEDTTNASDITTFTLDSVNDASVTLTARLAQGEATTITDVKSLTINAESTAATVSVGALAHVLCV